MTFDELLRTICEKKPPILNGGGILRMPPNGLCKALKLAYDTGKKEGFNACKEKDSWDFLQGIMGRGY